MARALQQVGFRTAWRYLYSAVLCEVYRLMFLPQLRVLYLRMCGVKIGGGTIINGGVRFINLHRMGYQGLSIGKSCGISDDVILDMADQITIGDNVTFGLRSMILTHLTVGHPDHPLHRHFPPESHPVVIEDGVFIGPNCTLLSGTTVGANSFVMLGTVITKDVPTGVLLGGNPGRVIRKL